MNKKLNKLNLFNWKNITLVVGAFIFIAFSLSMLVMQRNGYGKIVYFESFYLVTSVIFSFFIIYSISSYLYPIFSKFNRKKINSLNSKFTLYFISIALTPALIVGILGIILLNFGINDWFNQKIKNVVSNSVSIAESYLSEHKETIKGDIYAMSNDLNNGWNIYNNDINSFKKYLITQSLIRSLPETYLIDFNGNIVLSAFERKMIFYKPPKESLLKAANGELAIFTSVQANKVYALINLSNYSGLLLYAGRSMDANVIAALNETRSAKQEYVRLEKNRNQISIVFIVLYLVFTLLLILISMIVGLKTAQRIINPISSVIKASNKISKGDYGDKVLRSNDYIELDKLADSFNQMSSDLVKQRKQISVAKKYETWSDIARRIAHEIKNPLTPIQLSSERLIKKINEIPELNTDEINECVNSITRQVSEIGFLVDEFSNFARLPNPEFKKFNMCVLLNEVISDIAKSYDNIKMELTNQNDDIILEIDKMQITRVIHNILINSVNSINESDDVKEKGQILCKTKINNGLFIIEIFDNGGGIQYDKDELIKPYFTTRKIVGGSGLGLSIVEKILSDHNADFDLKNKSDGSNGAIATISFNIN